MESTTRTVKHRGFTCTIYRDARRTMITFSARARSREASATVGHAVFNSDLSELDDLTLCDLKWGHCYEWALDRQLRPVDDLPWQFHAIGDDAIRELAVTTYENELL